MKDHDSNETTGSTASKSARGLSGAQRDTGETPDEAHPSDHASETSSTDDVPRVGKRDASGSQSSYGSENLDDG
jgi:hypothetical protein